MEWGMKAGIFLDGVQVGALKNWTLHEQYQVLSRYEDKDGTPMTQKIIGWRASALRYLIKRSGLVGQELEFRFCSVKREYRICRGQIVGKYKVGRPTEGPIEMSGDSSPNLYWR